MKSTFVLFFTTTILACASTTPESQATVGSSAIGSDGLPASRITLTCDRKCTAKERRKIAEAERLINEIRSRPCFQDIYLKPNLSSQIVQTNGRTRQEVVDDIASRGADVAVTFYRNCNGVVGYRNKGSKTIHMNRCWHDRAKNDNAWAAASNALHESLHVMGYTHDFGRTARRPFSVPYRANRGVERCERELRR